jgi:hypothetical protein
MPPQRLNKEPIKDHSKGLALAVILASLCKPNAFLNRIQDILIVEIV